MLQCLFALGRVKRITVSQTAQFAVSQYQTCLNVLESEIAPPRCHDDCVAMEGLSEMKLSRMNKSIKFLIDPNYFHQLQKVKNTRQRIVVPLQLRFRW